MKRVKINFETINKGNYKIIPAEKIDESRRRIKSEMKKFVTNLIEKQEIIKLQYIVVVKV